MSLPFRLLEDYSAIIAFIQGILSSYLPHYTDNGHDSIIETRNLDDESFSTSRVHPLHISLSFIQGPLFCHRPDISLVTVYMFSLQPIRDEEVSA